MDLAIIDTLDPSIVGPGKDGERGAVRRKARPEVRDFAPPPKQPAALPRASEDTPGTRYAPGALNWRCFAAVAAIHVAAFTALLGMGVVEVPHVQHKRLTVFDVRPSAPQPRPQVQAEAPLQPVTRDPRPSAVKPMIELPLESSLVLPAAPPQPAVAVRIEAPAAPAGPPAPITPPDFSAAQLNNPGPHYPYASRRNREEGTALLKVLVTPEGRAGKVEVQQSSGFERLDMAAIQTVRAWRFVPARQAGEAIAAWVLVPIGFSLS